MQSHSKVLGVMASTHEFFWGGGYNSAHNRTLFIFFNITKSKYEV